MATHRTRSKPSRAKSEVKPKSRHWSCHVMGTSDAPGIEPDTFKSRDPARIAASFKASAEHSRRYERTAFQSTMSILMFYINQVGHSLSGGRRQILKCVKVALRAEFDRPAQSVTKARH